MAKQFAVIGLGRFGSSVALTLSRLGSEVLAVDLDEDKVKALASFVTQAVQADATDEAVLKELGLKNFDVVVVAISAFEASLLVTLHLKQLGVKRVVVKAAGNVHGKILEKVGADTIIFPEKDMGERVAYSLVTGSVVDYIDLSPDYGVVEIAVTGGLKGRTLRNLNLRHRMGLNVMAIKRGDTVKIYLDPDESLEEGDMLVAIGPKDGIQKLNEILERG